MTAVVGVEGVADVEAGEVRSAGFDIDPCGGPAEAGASMGVVPTPHTGSQTSWPVRKSGDDRPDRERDAGHARAGASADPPSGHIGRMLGHEVRQPYPDRLAQATQWDRRLARIKAIAVAVDAWRQLAAGDQ